MKEIKIQAVPDDEVYFIPSNQVTITTGVIDKITFTNEGIEYQVKADGHVFWTSIVHLTKEGLLELYKGITWK